MYFVDTSALVKAYIPEKGSETVQEAFQLLDGSLCISGLVAIETLGNLARLHRRRDISQKTYNQARSDLLNHYRTKFYVLPLPLTVCSEALALIHSQRSRAVGGADMLHLATAEHLQSLIPAEVVSLMCSDRALRKVAEERGFDVFDPEKDPINKLLPPTLPL